MRHFIDIDARMSPFVREIRYGQANREIPTAWDCYAVVNTATRQFCSGICKDPVGLLKVIKTQLGPRYKQLSVVMRQLIEKDPDYQYFIFSRDTRNEVERWFTSNGVGRITTKMGQGEGEESLLFRVVSENLGITRYVSAPVSTEASKIIELANTSFCMWLDNQTSRDFSLKATLRSATKSTRKICGKVFGPESTVEPTRFYTGRTVSEYRKVSTELNKAALIAFVDATRG